MRLDHPAATLCVILLTGIGDVVHGLPLVNALAARYPHLRITWVAEPAPAEVLRHHAAVERVIVFRKAAGFGGIRRLFQELSYAGPFDAAINAQRYFKSVWPTLFSRAPMRAGLPRDKTRDGVSLLNTHHLPGGPWRHTQDMFLEFLSLFEAVRPPELEWKIRLSDDERGAAAVFFAQHDLAPGSRLRVGLVAGTKNRAKDWPSERYPLLVDALHARDHQVFLLGGPGQSERATAARAMADSRTRPVDAMADSVRELMWKIAGMDLLISPDTGPVHLARAMGVPVIGLYGHTNPWRVGPYGAYADLVVDTYTDPGEAPDPSRYEPRSGRMERIRVDDVLARMEVAREAYGVGSGGGGDTADVARPD